MAQHSRPLPPPPTPGLVVPETSPPEGESDRPAEAAEQSTPAARCAPAEAAARTHARPAAPPPRPWHQRERWLVVSLLAFVPVLAALFAPSPMRVPLLGAGGGLIAAGVAMLVVHERSRRVRARR